MSIVVPQKLASNPRDKRGYVIPWNVQWSDPGPGGPAEPLFTVNDDRKHHVAIRDRLCPLCGTRLTKKFWFVGGPRSAFDPNGWYFDLPGHQECVEYALQVCPYLAAPRYAGRIDLPDPKKAPRGALLIDYTQIPERPVLFVAVAATKMLVRRAFPVVYVRPSKIIDASYWKFGTRLTLEEATPVIRQVIPGWEPSPEWSRE